MKVAVVNNTVPFLRGGAEVLADTLVERLRAGGHVADLVRLPFAWDPPERIADAMLAASLTRVAEVDRVIALKFPAYLVPHDDKVIWLCHQFRQFYDLWDDGARHDAATLEVRDMVLRGDDRAMAGVGGLFAISEVAASRLRRFNGFDAEVLHHPLPNPEQFGPLQLGDYIFAGGRINSFKRQLLAVRAMRYTSSSVRLIVAGAPESEADLGDLVAAREESGCADRIVLIPKFIAEHQKVELVNRSLACFHAPLDEDSYGYVTLEASYASKATVTTSDAGGVLDLVIDGRSGIVCPPDPVEIGRAFDLLHRAPEVAEELGAGAAERVRELRISWDHVLDRLLA